MNTNIQIMKPIYKYIVIFFFGFFAALFFIKGCEPVPAIPKLINTDSIKAIGRAEADTLQMLRNIATESQQTATIAVHHWHKAKHDTINVPYIVITNECDTALNRLEKANTDLCNELNQSYEVNAVKEKVIEGQDKNLKTVLVVNDSLRTDNKKLKRNNKLLTWLNGIQAALNLGQAVGR